jgi:hypothetical protein
MQQFGVKEDDEDDEEDEEDEEEEVVRAAPARGRPMWGSAAARTPARPPMRREPTADEGDEEEEERDVVTELLQFPRRGRYGGM